MDFKFVKGRATFIIVAIVLLFFSILLATNAGISADEQLHYGQAENVYKYFASAGNDKSALNSKGYLHFYGQSFENLSYLLIQIFNIENIYDFRHILSVIIGWLIIVLTGIFTVRLKNVQAGILAMILLFLSPHFLGHCYNNLTDIPFAFSYLFFLYHCYRMFGELPKITPFRFVMLSIGLFLSISNRVGGMICIPLMFLFTAVYIFIYRKSNIITIKMIVIIFLKLLFISIIGILCSILIWPYAIENGIEGIISSIDFMSNIPTGIYQLFEGQNILSVNLPDYFLIKSILITTPVIIFSGVALYTYFGIIRKKALFFISLFILLSFIFPLVYIIIKKSNVYSSWRHVLFIYPFIIISSAIGLEMGISYFKNKFLKIATIVSVGLLLVLPLKHIASSHPYEYIYYNELNGGLKEAYGFYELDYFYNSTEEASEWLIQYLNSNEKKTKEKINIVTNRVDITQYCFRKDTSKINVLYSSYRNIMEKNWDYGIIINTQIDAYLLQNTLWPPKGTIHTIDVNGFPICAIIKRDNKYEYLGYKAQKENNIDSALIYYNKLKQDSSTIELSYKKLGYLHHRSGNIDSAYYYYQKALKKYSEDCDMLAQTGLILTRKHKTKEALSYLQKSLQIRPDNITALSALVQLYYQNKDYDNAIKILNRILYYKPNDRNINNTLKYIESEAQKNRKI